jgi:hypothetical protein
MAPVIQLCKATMNGELEKVTKMTGSLGITMKKDEMGL